VPEAPLSAGFDLLVLDLDGVLYVGPDAVPGAVEALRAAALPTGFATNNASRTPEEVADHLTGLGIPARPEQVTTSSQAGARLVVEHAGDGARVLPVGGPGVRAALLEAGLTAADPAEAAASRPDAVLQGFGRQVGWSDLCDVAVAVQAGALWVATNTDLSIPTDRGIMPGNGALVGAVRHAVDVDPLVAGKPGPAIFEVVAERAGATRPLVVGDRLDTDIGGAVAASMPSLLVLTGVSTPADLFAAAPQCRPTHVGADLGSLAEEHPVLAELPGEDGVWRWRGAAARVADGVVSVTGDDAGTPGLLDQLRVAVAAAWSVPGGRARADDGAAALMAEVRRRCAVHP
jgi:HAD superfamily hydrolase (TIGR01450 family)